jgi:hypothetical protein
MNHSSPVVFASGTCRLLLCFDPTVQEKVGIPCDSIHHFHFGWKGGRNFLGKLHTAKQHLVLLQFLGYDLCLSKQEQQNLLSMSSQKAWWKAYTHHDPHYTYPTAIQNIRERIHECNVFLFEICSIKNTVSFPDGIPVQTEIVDDDTMVHTQSVEECREDVIRLIEYVDEKFNHPTIILMGHVRNWLFNPDHKYLAERQSIYELLVEMDQLYENVFYVDPAIFLSQNDMNDDWHYKDYGEAYAMLYRKICSLWRSTST